MVIETGPTTVDKIMYWVLGIIFVAFLISLPFMIRDKERREAQMWQEQGCHMYDEVTSKKLPNKCANYFTDHYKPQAERLQPPDEN